MSSSIHAAPSKKLANSFLTRTLRRAWGKARRTARNAGRLMTMSPSQLTSFTRTCDGFNMSQFGQQFFFLLVVFGLFDQAAVQQLLQLGELGRHILTRRGGGARR